jgi:hypothetical protein
MQWTAMHTGRGLMLFANFIRLLLCAVCRLVWRLPSVLVFKRRMMPRKQPNYARTRFYPALAISRSTKSADPQDHHPCTLASVHACLPR